MTRQLPVLVLVVVMARTAAAQDFTLAPADPKRWDAGVAVGWLGGDKGEIADRWNDWYDTFAFSLEVGRYWTAHVKTAVDATFTTDGDVYSQEQLATPGQPVPAFFTREHRFGVSALSASASWQFLENRWVHPFVGGGVQLAWERHRIEDPFPFAFGRDGRGRFPVPPASAAPGTRFDPRPFVTGGAKLYVGERGFIRSDLSAAFDGAGASRVWWRIGAGVDF